MAVSKVSGEKRERAGPPVLRKGKKKEFPPRRSKGGGGEMYFEFLEETAPIHRRAGQAKGKKDKANHEDPVGRAIRPKGAPNFNSTKGPSEKGKARHLPVEKIFSHVNNVLLTVVGNPKGSLFVESRAFASDLKRKGDVAQREPDYARKGRSSPFVPSDYNWGFLL